MQRSNQVNLVRRDRAFVDGCYSRQLPLSLVVVGDRRGVSIIGGIDRNVGVAGSDRSQRDGDLFISFDDHVVDDSQVNRAGGYAGRQRDRSGNGGKVDSAGG